eukprot:gene4749-8657_t
MTLLIYSGAIALFVLVMATHTFTTEVAPKKMNLISIANCSTGNSLRRDLRTYLPQFVFVKTHKTGSSTLTVLLANILEQENVYPAFGKDGRVGWPNSFVDVERQLKEPAADQFHAIITHIRWDTASFSTVNRLLGRVFTFTLLRDPLDRFISACHYDGFGPFYGLFGLVEQPVDENILNLMLDKLEDTNYFMQYLPEDTAKEYLTSYVYDLGLGDDPLLLNENSLEHDLKLLDSRIDFVLITERWGESMALLRRHLCQPLSRFVWLSHKVNSIRNSAQDISEATRLRFRRVFWHEYRIYDKYKARFDSMITPEISREASLLDSLSKQLTQRCRLSRSDCPLRNDVPETMKQLHKRKLRAFGLDPEQDS